MSGGGRKVLLRPVFRGRGFGFQPGSAGGKGRCVLRPVRTCGMVSGRDGFRGQDLAAGLGEGWKGRERRSAGSFPPGAAGETTGGRRRRMQNGREQRFCQEAACPAAGTDCFVSAKKEAGAASCSRQVCRPVGRQSGRGMPGGGSSRRGDRGGRRYGGSSGRFVCGQGRRQDHFAGASVRSGRHRYSGRGERLLVWRCI